MITGHIAFMTYMLIPNTGVTNIYGYKDAIHSNNIKKIQFDDLINKEFNIYFENVDEFRFLSVSGGTGYSANKLIVLAQLIDIHTGDDVNKIKPESHLWKYFDVTDQISGHTGQTLSAADVTSTVFRVPIGQYNLAPPYNLDYLNYPVSGTSGNSFCFGDETYFIGNVTTSVEAIAYTMDLAINLPLNQFNSSNNETWKGETVFISEIGLYDANKNLVGIAKLNDPIPKDATIARTIVFGMDF